MNASRRAELSLPWLLLPMLGCAPAAAPAATHARAPDGRFVPAQREPYAPPPGRHGRTGGAQALIVGSGEAQARATALAFARALLDGDRDAAHGLLSPRVVHAVDGRLAPRDSEVERCIGGAEALSYEPDLNVEDVIEVRAVEVQRAQDYHGDMPIPVGLEPSDLVVTLPVQADNAAHGRIPCLARVYVRTGSKAQIVGLTR